MMKEIIERFRAKTPKFFKKLQLIAGSVATVTTSAAVAYASMPDVFRDLIPQGLLKYIAIAAFTAATVAQFTKEHSTDSNTPQS